MQVGEAPTVSLIFSALPSQRVLLELRHLTLPHLLATPRSLLTIASWEETGTTLTWGEGLYFTPGRPLLKMQTNCRAGRGCGARGQPAWARRRRLCFTLAFKTLSGDFLCPKQPSCTLHNPKGQLFRYSTSTEDSPPGLDNASQPDSSQTK